MSKRPDKRTRSALRTLKLGQRSMIAANQTGPAQRAPVMRSSQQAFDVGFPSGRAPTALMVGPRAKFDANPPTGPIKTHIGRPDGTGETFNGVTRPAWLTATKDAGKLADKLDADAARYHAKFLKATGLTDKG